MFSKLVILCWAAACVFAAPPTDVIPLEKQQPTVIPIVSQSEELESNGTYKFSYETGNGIKREETSYDKVIPKAQGRSADSNEGGESGDSEEIHVQQGSYSYTAPDGTVISVRYIADENGFQPIGDHIPRVPAPSQDASSGRSSKALNVADSAGAGSVPAIASRTAAKPESAPVAEEDVLTEDKPKNSKLAETKPEAAPEEADAEKSKPEEAKPGVESAEAASKTPAADSTKTIVAEASTTEANASDATEAASTPNASDAPAEPSTTEGPKTSEGPTEAASTEAPISTEAPKVDADASTVAAESTPASTEASTTEAGSTTSVKA